MTVSYLIRGIGGKRPYVNFSDGVRSRAPFCQQMKTSEDAERLAVFLAASLTDADPADVRACVLIARDECLECGLIRE